MKKLLILSSILLLFSLFANAGTTTVTATLTDADGQTWNNCNVIASFAPVAGVSEPYLVNGSTFTKLVTTSCNSSGVFTMPLTDNNTITPIGSHWQFQICPNATSRCVQTGSIIVTGVTQNLSSILSATLGQPRINAALLPSAYTNTEINNPQVGMIYWNVLSNIIRNWNGSSWVDLGSGSGTLNSSGSITPGNCSQWLNSTTLVDSGGVCGAGGGGAFSAITSGTNSTAAMIVNTGASLNYSNNGTINATTLVGSTWNIPPVLGSGIANTVLSSAVTGVPITPSAGPVLTVTGGVAGTYEYGVCSLDNNGYCSPSATTVIVNGPTTLDGTHFIDVGAWTNTGAVNCVIYRIQGDNGGLLGLGIIGTTTCGSNIHDDGLTGDGSTFPTINSSGSGSVSKLDLVGSTSEKATIQATPTGGSVYIGPDQSLFDPVIQGFFGDTTTLQTWNLNSSNGIGFGNAIQGDGSTIIIGNYAVTLLNGNSNADSTAIQGVSVANPAVGQTSGGTITGVNGNVANTGAGVVQSLIGIYSSSNSNSGGGVVFDNFGSKIDMQIGVGVNNYGQFIVDQGTGANDYANYIEGGKSVFPAIASGVVANTDLTGQLTLSSGTKTLASTYLYVSPLICVASSTAATPLAVQVTSTIASTGAIKTSASNASVGTSYVPGDKGTIDGGTGATYYVLTVGGSGEVGSYILKTSGTAGYSVAAAVTTTATSGIGTGFKIDVLSIAGVNTLTLTVPGGINGDTYNYICMGRD